MSLLCGVPHIGVLECCGPVVLATLGSDAFIKMEALHHSSTQGLAVKLVTMIINTAIDKVCRCGGTIVDGLNVWNAQQSYAQLMLMHDLSVKVRCSMAKQALFLLRSEMIQVNRIARLAVSTHL